MSETNESVEVVEAAEPESNETENKVTEDMVPEFIVELGSAEITKERVIALVRAVLMVVTSIASLLGVAFDADAAYQIILVVLMAASLIWGYWKNNNWTQNAVAAQDVKSNITVVRTGSSEATE